MNRNPDQVKTHDKETMIIEVRVVEPTITEMTNTLGQAITQIRETRTNRSRGSECGIK
jgi:hypothetical protein